MVVVITRYFGGIKLGGGGLIRAYTKGAKIGLEAGTIVDMVLHREISFNVDYNQYGKIENFLMTNNYITNDIIFGSSVEISLYIKVEELEKFKKDITNLTNGDSIIEELENKYLPILNGRRLA